MKAQEIENAKEGTLFVIKGELWMRMEDSVALNIEGSIVHVNSGKWSHWQRIIEWDEEIA